MLTIIEEIIPLMIDDGFKIIGKISLKKALKLPFNIITVGAINPIKQPVKRLFVTLWNTISVTYNYSCNFVNWYFNDIIVVMFF